MNSKIKCLVHRSGKQGFILAVLMLGLHLSACLFWEPNAPSRSFDVDSLFLDDDCLPTGWVALEPFQLIGHDLCGHDCKARGFLVAGSDELDKTAMQEVFRYDSEGIAERVFSRKYTPPVANLTSVDQWTLSPLADQSFFGCGLTAGNERIVCDWAARYKEYIVVFSADRDPPYVDLAEIEQVVRAIDARMALYLELTE